MQFPFAPLVSVSSRSLLLQVSQCVSVNTCLRHVWQLRLWWLWPVWFLLWQLQFVWPLFFPALGIYNLYTYTDATHGIHCPGATADFKLQLTEPEASLNLEGDYSEQKQVFIIAMYLVSVSYCIVGCVCTEVVCFKKTYVYTWGIHVCF